MKRIRKFIRRALCSLTCHVPHVGYKIKGAPCYRCSRCFRWLQFTVDGWQITKYATPEDTSADPRFHS